MTYAFLKIRKTSDVYDMVADARDEFDTASRKNMYLFDEITPHIVRHKRLSHRGYVVCRKTGSDTSACDNKVADVR